MLAALPRKFRWNVSVFRVKIQPRRLHTESKVEVRKALASKAKRATKKRFSPERPTARQVTVSIEQPEQAVRKDIFREVLNMC